jgi:hypothetical protein
MKPSEAKRQQVQAIFSILLLASLFMGLASNQNVSADGIEQKIIQNVKTLAFGSDGKIDWTGKIEAFSSSSFLGATFYEAPVTSIPVKIVISRDAQLPLVGESKTPNICATAEYVSEPSKSGVPNNRLAITPLTEGLCNVLVTNPGNETVMPISKEISITFAKAKQYVNFTYNGANFIADTKSIMTEGGAQISVVGKYPEPDMKSGHLKVKDSLVSLTKPICSVALYKELAAFGTVGYKVFAHKPGNCTLHYKSKATSQYLAVDEIVKFKFVTMKNHMNVFTKNPRLWCDRITNSIFELLDIPYKTSSGKSNSCPNGYLTEKTL